MSFERPSTPENKKSIDADYFEAFKRIEVRVVNGLDLNQEKAEEQRVLIEQNAIDLPQLEYPNIDLETLEKAEQEILDLKTRIESDETLPVSGKRAYLLSINAKLAAAWMLMATANGDMRKFSRYSEFIYGKPSELGWEYTKSDYIDLLDYGTHSAQENVRDAAERLRGAVHIERGNTELSRPSDDLVAQVENATKAEIGHIFPDLELEREYTPTEIADVFRVALTKLGINDWQVEIVPNKVSISVNSSQKIIKVPEGRKHVTGKYLRELVGHEIGTHILRATNGEKSGFALLSTGLDRYEAAEEGIASIRGSIAAGEKLKGPDGLEGHLAIGLALGMDGQPRNFRELYDVFLDFYRIYVDREEPNTSNPEDNARYLAWRRACRTFRGTDGKTPGVCFTKDIMYQEGGIKVWQAFEKNPEFIAMTSLGKFDPGNEEHLALLRELNIGQ